MCGRGLEQQPRRDEIFEQIVTRLQREREDRGGFRVAGFLARERVIIAAFTQQADQQLGFVYRGLGGLPWEERRRD